MKKQSKIRTSSEVFLIRLNEIQSKSIALGKSRGFGKEGGGVLKKKLLEVSYKIRKKTSACFLSRSYKNPFFSLELE